MHTLQLSKPDPTITGGWGISHPGAPPRRGPGAPPGAVPDKMPAWQLRAQPRAPRPCLIFPKRACCATGHRPGRGRRSLRMEPGQATSPPAAAAAPADQAGGSKKDAGGKASVPRSCVSLRLRLGSPRLADLPAEQTAMRRRPQRICWRGSRRSSKRRVSARGGGVGLPIEPLFALSSRWPAPLWGDSSRCMAGQQPGFVSGQWRLERGAGS